MYDIITGSHGFCGKYLAEYLLKNGKTVICIPRELLLNPIHLQQFLHQYQPFRIYNLMAYGNLHGQNDNFEIMNTIVGKLLNLLEATKDLDCRGFVTAGSTSEYGVKDKPMTETMMLHPTSVYGAAKAAATHLVQAWVAQYDKPVVVYRPASITGVDEQRIHLIPVLIKSCIDQEPIDFIGPPTHDFINVRDVVRAISILGETAEEHKGEIFNVGTEKQWTNSQVLTMIEVLTGKKANIRSEKKLRDFESSTCWVTDSTKMKALGWEATVPLLDSLEEMVKAYAK